MKVGVIGTGAISWKHAHAYKNIGYEIVACTSTNTFKGREFAKATGAKFVETYEEVCRHPSVDYVDVCTFPNFRLQPLQICAETKKHVLVEKPIATDLKTAQAMIELSRKAGIQLGVVSQHRFDDSSQFLKDAIAEGRLGRLLQADAYVKWHRSAEYYKRPVKGSWAGEGGGALINQAIHQVDLLLFLAGAVTEVFGYWQLGALHTIESEDVISALLRFSSGATGVIQAATALWPGYPERLEIHGTKGTAIITGDKLTTWNAQSDKSNSAPIACQIASGASDPMAISTLPFERQLRDFGEACKAGRAPLSSGTDGYQALQVVTSIYKSCIEKQKIAILSRAI